MSRKIVARLQKPKSATSAVKKAISYESIFIPLIPPLNTDPPHSLVNALKTPAAEAEHGGTVEEAEVEEVENVTNVVKLAISPVRALRPVEEEGTPPLAAVTVVRRRLGKYFPYPTVCRPDINIVLC